MLAKDIANNSKESNGAKWDYLAVESENECTRKLGSSGTVGSSYWPNAAHGCYCVKGDTGRSSKQTVHVL